ncbi:uncharacterized protein DS421_3g96740 [Arachis hypogaea]|nr:uncharacterized protein DS421_3g96740 [Arachis hypogaea]
MDATEGNARILNLVFLLPRQNAPPFSNVFCVLIMGPLRFHQESRTSADAKVDEKISMNSKGANDSCLTYLIEMSN